MVRLFTAHDYSLPRRQGENAKNKLACNSRAFLHKAPGVSLARELEAYIPIEDAVGFQVPGNDEQNAHGTRNPAEHLNWERCGEPRSTGVWLLRRVAKNQSAYQGDYGCQCQPDERFADLFMHIH
jgi:hypothetical protein